MTIQFDDVTVKTIFDLFSFNGGWKRLGSTQLGNDRVWHKLNPPGAFDIIFALTCFGFLPLCSSAHQSTNNRHLGIWSPMTKFSFLLRCQEICPTIRKKIKCSAQDQSNMNLFDSKDSFFIYFFCQRLIRTYETVMWLIMIIIMITIRRWTFRLQIA